jgi:hypothetical protein
LTGAFFDVGFFAVVFLVLDEEAGRVAIGGGEAEVLEDIVTVKCDSLGETDCCNGEVQNWQNLSVEVTKDGAGNQVRLSTFIPKTRSVTCGRVCCLLINKTRSETLFRWEIQHRHSIHNY